MVDSKGGTGCRARDDDDDDDDDVFVYEREIILDIHWRPAVAAPAHTSRWC